MTQTVQLLANNQFQVIAATPEQVAQLKPRLQLVQDRGHYIVRVVACLLVGPVVCSLYVDQYVHHLYSYCDNYIGYPLKQEFRINFVH